MFSTTEMKRFNDQDQNFMYAICNQNCFILLSVVTSYYVIDQSMISICDMKKMFGGE